MTGRIAGRHRGRQHRPPSQLLMDDQAGDEPFADYRVSAFVPAARRRADLSPAGRNRALVVVLAGLAAAAMAGGITLSRSSDAAPAHHLPESLPRPSVTSPDPVTTTTAPPQRARRSADAGPDRRPALIQARSAPVITPRPSPSAPAPQPAARRPAIVVTYLVARQGLEGFQGEVQVTNNTEQPIANWQIVVDLNDDAVTSFTNAAGSFSNGIVLLGPASPAQVVPPDGGVLDVFFVAQGTQKTPAACTFDGIPCG